jgi:glycosyltransferase involved in cell wall biosynthesis
MLNNRKKIIVFIDWFLPGYKAGGPIQSCANLIDHLKDEYDFSVVTRDTDYCETQPYPNVKSNEWNILPNGKRVYYFSSDQLNKKNIKVLIKKEQYDIIYMNGIFSFWFTLLPLYYAKKKNAKNIVIAARGMFAVSALSIKKIKKRFFLLVVKIIRLFNGIIFQATTQQESNDIKTELGKKVQIKIAPNLPKKKNTNALYHRIKEKGCVRIVNIARISPEKNLKYALEVLQKVKGKVEFDIYGPVYNKPYWDECSVLIQNMPLNVKVFYKQSIESERIEEALKNYHFMFMPTRGENFGHIILESLSSGCPVIISDQTVWRNLEEKKIGWDLSLLNHDNFTKVIERAVKMSQEEYDSISNRAFNYAHTFINNKETIEQNIDLFRFKN